MSSNKISKISMIVDASQAKGEYGALTTEAAGFSKAAASSGVVAQASLTQLEQAQRRVAASSTQMATGVQQVANAERQAAVAGIEAAGANQALATAQEEVAVASRGAALASILQAEANQAGSVSAEQLAAANAMVAAESEISAGKMIKLGVAIDKLAGVSVAGGKAMGSLAGAFSAMSLGQLALIAGVAILIGWLLKRIKAEHEVIEIGEEGLKLDIARANTMQGQQNITKDIVEVLIKYSQTRKALAADTLKETEAYYALAAAERVEDDMKARGVERSYQAQLTGKLMGTTITDQREGYMKLSEARKKDEEGMKKVME